jgi:2-oxoglutarate dehydrogenase complex dehydrogenase (E1) component-like enzyme
MMKEFNSSSYLFGGNAPYVEELYESYLNNPGSVPDQWRTYFDTMQMVPAADGNPQTPDVAHAPIVQSFAERAKDGTLQPRVMGGDAAAAIDAGELAGRGPLTTRGTTPRISGATHERLPLPRVYVFPEPVWP